MAYIGAQPNKSLTKTTSQSFNGTGSATVFTLNRAVNSSEELEVFVDNVQQEPGSGKSYVASGTTLTFDEAPPSGTGNVYVIYRGLAEVTTRLEAPDLSITTAKLADDAVTKAKIGATELDLATIKDSSGTNTALTIDSTGRVFQPAKPIMSLRGASTFSSSSPFSTDTAPDTGGDISVISNLREVTAWSQTHINQGGMYGSDGRLTAPVAGIYQFTISCSRTYNQTDMSRSLWVVHRPAGSSSCETIYYTWTAGDYGWYSHGFTHIMTLAANDQISVGAYVGYTWHPDIAHAHFSGQLIG